MPKRLVLVIDDEKDILKLLQYNLEKEGYQVLTAATGEAGFEMARSKSPDLILLDLMLPGVDGLEICKMLRADPKTRQVPVLMLTAKNTETDQIVGLEIGASDYIAKPFSVRVLLARVKNAFRHRESQKDPGVVLKAGELLLDREKQRVSLKGKTIPMTKLEFNILAHLMANPGRVFSRDELLDGAWKGEAFVTDRTVDVHMRSIRQKLGRSRDMVETVRGSGYRFAESGPEAPR